MHRIGGRAHVNGITFESDFGRVYASDSGADTVKLFSARTRSIKAALRKVPLLRVFVSFGKAGTVIFILLVALLIAGAFAPGFFSFGLLIPDHIFYISLATVVIVLLLIALLMRGSVKRLLQHHGAEHMTINTYRSGKALTADNIAAADRATPSCGSFFVLVFIIVGVPLMFVPNSDYLLPLGLCVAFELSLLARKVKWLRWLLRFGLWAQRKFFTREPDAAQIEAARRGLMTLIALADNENPKE